MPENTAPELTTDILAALHDGRCQKLHNAVRELHLCYLQEARSDERLEQMLFEEGRRMLRQERDAATRLRKLIAETSPQLAKALRLSRTA